jgi:hypothetical protein
MLDRPDWARKAGFDGVEVLFPYDHPAADWEKALAGMPVALINTPPGDWISGDRGFAARPGDEAAFRDGFLRAADWATRLGAARVHVMAGVAKGPLAEAVFAENLAWAAAQAPALRLTVEPLNPDDMPGYFLNDYDQAARILDDLAPSAHRAAVRPVACGTAAWRCGGGLARPCPPYPACADRGLSRPQRAGRRRLLAARRCAMRWMRRGWTGFRPNTARRKGTAAGPVLAERAEIARRADRQPRLKALPGLARGHADP